MKWTVYFVLATAACQSGDTKEAPANTTVIQLPRAQVTDTYRADITTLCDVEHLSSADQKPQGERQLITAMFLGSNLRTEEGRAFVLAIKPLQGAAGDAYALALETEAKRAGLASCALASQWRASRR